MKMKMAARVLRWTARVWSLLAILLVCFFAIGESVGSSGPPSTPQEWLGLALWPIGSDIGLILAWFRERTGGIVAIAFFAAFYLWNLIRSGHLPSGPSFLLMTAPAFLFLTAGFWPRNSVPRQA
jgi:ABC-type amino acid transport system permease subunit